MNSEIAQRSLRAMFWISLVFALVMALLPHPPALMGHLNDKVQHMTAFATLTFLAVLAFRRLSYRAIFAALALFGAGIEILQMIPALHRDAELGDWLADCVAVLAVLVLSALMRGAASRS